MVFNFKNCCCPVSPENGGQSSEIGKFKNERGCDAGTSQPRKHILTEDFQIISRRCVREYRSTIFGKSFSASPENRRQNGFLTQLN
jgi:hypothetical protein